MKNILIIVTLLTITSLLSGCASKGYQRADSTSTSLQLAADRVDTCGQQVDLVVASLADLLNEPAADLKPQFQAFTTAVSKLESQARDIRSRTRTLERKEEGYFQKWNQELALIQDEQMRNRSAGRKAAVMNQFTNLKTSYSNAQNALNPFIAELKDIKRVLSVDLTPAGLAAFKDALATAQTDGTIVRNSLNKLAADFKELGNSLSTKTPEPAT